MKQLELVALDLEGSGAQDRDQEAILEIALVPIRDWQPDLAAAYHTLINPGRSIPRRSWISPGLNNTVLQNAPPLADVEAAFADRIRGRHLVGHNIAVDWRLLQRRCPTVLPAGLVDTLRLARILRPKDKNSLGTLISTYQLTDTINAAAPGSTPHRALWDTIAAASLLPALLRDLLGRQPVLDDLRPYVDQLGEAAGPAPPDPQPTLFD